MVQADLYPQIIYYLSGLFTMKPLIAAAKAMFSTLDAAGRENLLHTVAFSLFQGSRQVCTLVALMTVEAQIHRLQRYICNGVQFTYGTPRGRATCNGLQSVIVEHGLVQVYLHSFERDPILPAITFVVTSIGCSAFMRSTFPFFSMVIVLTFRRMR